MLMLNPYIRIVNSPDLVGSIYNRSWGNNIPYKFEKIIEFQGFSLCRLYFYERGPLLKVSTIEELFDIYSRLDYDQMQLDPRKLFITNSGNCQSISISLKRNLENLGYKSKFIFTSDHVYIEASKDSTIIKLDPTNKIYEVIQ